MKTGFFSIGQPDVVIGLAIPTIGILMVAVGFYAYRQIKNQGNEKGMRWNGLKRRYLTHYCHLIL